MLPVRKFYGELFHRRKRLGDKYPLLLRDWKKQGDRIVYEKEYRNQSILPRKIDYPRSIDPPSSFRTLGDFLYFICIFLELRYTGFVFERRKSHKEDVSDNSKEKEPCEGSFSVIGTCGSVSACSDLSLPERE
jgi:hypothetical protein